MSVVNHFSVKQVSNFMVHLSDPLCVFAPRDHHYPHVLWRRLSRTLWACPLRPSATWLLTPRGLVQCAAAEGAESSWFGPECGPPPASTSAGSSSCGSWGWSQWQWAQRRTRTRPGHWHQTSPSFHPRLLEELFQRKQPQQQQAVGHARVLVQQQQHQRGCSMLSSALPLCSWILPGSLRRLRRQLQLQEGAPGSAGIWVRAHVPHGADLQWASGGVPSALLLHEVVGWTSEDSGLCGAPAGSCCVCLCLCLRPQRQWVVQHVWILVSRWSLRCRFLWCGHWWDLLYWPQDSLCVGGGRAGLAGHRDSVGAGDDHVLPHHPPGLQLVATDWIRHKSGSGSALHGSRWVTGPEEHGYYTWIISQISQIN